MTEKTNYWRERALAAEKDETAEILADTDFADALQESIKQVDAGKTHRWEEIKAEMGL